MRSNAIMEPEPKNSLLGKETRSGPLAWLTGPLCTASRGDATLRRIRFSRIVAVAGLSLVVSLASVRPVGAHQVELTATCAIPDSPATVLLPTTAHTLDCALDTGVDSDPFAFGAVNDSRIRVVLASRSDHLDPRLIVPFLGG